MNSKITNRLFRFQALATGDNDRCARIHSATAKQNGVVLRKQDLSESQGRNSKLFGDSYSPISFQVEVDGADEQWLDLIEVNSCDFNLYVMHKAVVEQLRVLNCDGLRLFRLEECETSSQNERNWISNYRGVLLTPGIQIEIPKHLGGPPNALSPKSFLELARLDPLVPVARSWTGGDLFCPETIPFQSRGCCSWRVVELARKHRWTNFRFTPMNKKCRGKEDNSIDYLGTDWPPADWPVDD